MNNKMKNSGVEWIGKIPIEWEVARIGSVYKLRNSKVSDYDYMPLSVTMNGVVSQLDNAAKTNAHEDRKLVLKGDFAINSRSDRRGACGISDYNGSVSLINTVITPIENMSPRYYNWIFHTEQFADEFYKCGHGIVDDLWTTSWQEMKNINITMPNIEEQTKIANFLDEKCSKIDRVIKDINQQIETLENYKKSLINDLVTGKKVFVGAKLCEPEKTKDSGIEWIGRVPEEWKVIKLKYVSKVRNEKNELDYSLDYFALENIESWNSKYVETKNTYSPVGSNLCYKGDLVFGKLRPYLAKTFIVDYDRCCSSEFAIFYAFKEYNKFLLYTISSYGFITVVDSSTYGTKMPRANIEFIIDMYIPIPPLSEQYKITDYLDTKCSKIDNIINQKKNQIDTLEKYKKSIIFEYVTGKKQVILGGTNE